MCFVTVFFVVEIVLQLIATPGYFSSLLFWMDVIGTLSMLFEISFLLGSAGHSKFISVNGSATIARSVRATRLAARAARFLRVVKAMSLIVGRENTRTPQLDHTAHLLAEKFSMVLVMVVCLVPILHLEAYPVEDYSMKAWVERLEYNYAKDFYMLKKQAIGVNVTSPPVASPIATIGLGNGTVANGTGRRRLGDDDDASGVLANCNAANNFQRSVEAMVEFYNDINYFPFKLQCFDGDVTYVDGQIKGQDAVYSLVPVRREYILQMFVPVCQAIRPNCTLKKNDLRGKMGNEIAMHEIKSMRTRASVSFDFETPVKIQAVVDILTNALVLGVMVYVSHVAHKILRDAFDAKH
jgi:hypothetical protein